MPGTLQVDVKVQDRSPLRGGIEVNNRQAPNTSEWRTVGYLRYDNLFQREHSFGVTYQTAPLNTSELRVLSATYALTVPGTENVLALFGVRSRNDVAAVGDIRVAGDGAIMGARYVVPLRGRDSFSHSITLGIDHKNFGESVRLIGADEISTPISYTPLSAAYSATVTGEKGTTRMSVFATTALRGLLGNSDFEFQRRRSQARANFFILRPELQRDQKMTEALSLFGRIGGQFASQPLISSESFFAGGLDSVRGYLEAERVGDLAYYGSAELRAPGVGRPAGKIDEWGPFVFIDAASVRILKALPSQASRFDLLSAGVGLRMRAWTTLSAQFVAGWPFEDGLETRHSQPRYTLRVAYDF